MGFARVPTPKMTELGENKTKSEQSFNKNLPPPYLLRRYYLPQEVAEHCTKDDCWVTLFNMVFDLTKLIAENHENSLCDPIVLAAGTDITHWFHPETRDPKKIIDEQSGNQIYFCPNGRYLHVPPKDPNSKSNKECKSYELPWWADTENYMIGRLTKKVR